MTLINNISSDKFTSKEPPSLDDFNFPEKTYIFLIGFSYDTPTKETSTWIKDILINSNRQKQILRFQEDDPQIKAKLTAELEKELERVEIFCGHGEIDGLYGPPYYSIAQGLLKPYHSIIYDVDMIASGPSSMFAFCCNAADSFGREFATKPGNSFIGFKGEIYFPKAFYKDLKYIFQTIAKDIIQEGKIKEKHKDMFITEIDELLKNTRSKYKGFAPLMESYLLHYKQLFVTQVASQNYERGV